MRRRRSLEEWPMIVVSSAYAQNVRVGTDIMRLKRGWIERLNKRGANGSPWGTP